MPRNWPIRITRKARAFLLSLALLLAVALLLDRWFPVPLHKASQLSALVLDREDTVLRGFASADGYWRLPVELDQVDAGFIAMLLAFEDRRFYWHPGIDPLALLRACGQWLLHGRIISGASTLTMQTARLLESIPHTLSGKLWQIGRALQLEWHLDKAEILQLYLQLAPYGGNLEGVRAASLAYFGKEPTYLTPAQSALLVALPQSPTRLRPDRAAEAARQARNKVLTRLYEYGLLNEQTWREASQQAVPEQRRELPLLAPHLARRLHQQTPQQSRIRSTLDGRLQRQLQDLGAAALVGLGPQVNLAILVVNHRDQTVLAHLGSADFFATARAGQVDLSLAVRSPGSTLKPVVYGMGFEDKLIHPLTRVNDVPTRFGHYQPSNFLHSYHGEVSVREALQQSLNIPAVAVLDQIGPGRVAARLQQAGINLHWPAGQTDPGLPLVLGGVGMTLTDLTTLYAALANDGRVRPLRYRQVGSGGAESGGSVADSEGVPLLTAAAAWQLRDILRGTPPPVSAIPYANQRTARRIGYKTGTSYGFRDAWAMGFDNRYTVGVWLGRPDGTPNPGRHGANTAAPLLFRVFDLLPPAPGSADPAPAEVLQVSRNEQLPQTLRYLSSTTSTDGQTGGEPLRITFPVDGTTLELNTAQLPLVASGGRKPLQWLVNGRPVASSAFKRQALWPVDGVGAVDITVLDSAGQSAAATVWLSGPVSGLASP